MKNNDDKTIYQQDFHYKIVKLFALIIFIGYLIPILLMGENCPTTVFDNLDSFENQYLHIGEGKLFSNNSTIVDAKMGGIPRAFYPSEFTALALIFSLFSFFKGYMFLIVSMKVVAFISMFVFLKTHIINIKDDFSLIIIIGVSLSFALLPFYPAFQYAIAAQPLLVSSLLSIRKEVKNIFDWVIIALFPIFSSLIAADFFIISVFAIIWLWDIFKTKKINYHLFYALAIISIMSIAVNYRLFLTTVFPLEIHHRVEFFEKGLSLFETFKQMLKHFIGGQVHYLGMQFPFIYLSGIIAIILGIKTKSKNYYWVIIKFFFALGIISVFFAIWHWLPITIFKNNFGILRTIQFDRFYGLVPIIASTLFAFSLMHIIKKTRFGIYVVYTLLSLQLLILFSIPSFKFQASGYPEIIYSTIVDKNYKFTSFKSFKAEELFNEIDEFIGKDKKTYRVISIGMQPSIALINGFYTLDGYTTMYSLKYKHEFRKIIENELNKDKDIKDYFDNWGSRCYIFTEELRKNFKCQKEDKEIVKNLKINTDQLKIMGGKYIFSAVEIVNYKDISLQFLNKFSDNNSLWNVFLYEII